MTPVWVSKEVWFLKLTSRELMGQTFKEIKHRNLFPSIAAEAFFFAISVRFEFQKGDAKAHWLAENKINVWICITNVWVKCICMLLASFLWLPASDFIQQPCFHIRGRQSSEQIVIGALGCVQPFCLCVLASCPLCQISFNHCYWLFLITAFGFISSGEHL